MTSCPVCKTPNCVKEARETADFYKCSRCGRFALTGSVVGTLETYFKEVPLRAAIMSHTLRRAHRDKESPRAISTNELPSYWSSGRLPTPQEQADSLILWIGENQHTPAIDVKSSELALDAWIGAPLSKTPGNAPGLRWIVDQLQSGGLFRHHYGKGEVWFSLHLPGWNKYAALKQKAVNSRIGFMAMKFRDAVLDGVVRDHFKPAVAKTGFELRLLTDEQPAGLIDNQLRAAILSARFLIADLSHDNPGAYWEAGFADGLSLPVIYTCETEKWAKSKTHFDTNHMRTIIWDANDPAVAAIELTATIRATLRAEANQVD